MPKFSPKAPAIRAKKDKVATAVMISGTISGRLMTMKAAGRPRHGFTRVIPIAASVAQIVETIVALTEMISVFSAALWNSSLAARCRTSRPTPSQWVTSEPVLNENHQDQDRHVEHATQMMAIVESAGP